MYHLLSFYYVVHIYTNTHRLSLPCFVLFLHNIQMHPTDVNVEIRPQNEYCQSNHMTIFVGSIYAYKGLLMVSFLFLRCIIQHIRARI